MSGKAKFGIFGDGKEVAQLAMAKHFKNGDFRSGYYRDQTFMMAAGLLTVQEFFAQLYAHPDIDAEPSSAGRQMNAHSATRTLNLDGTFKDLTKIKNSSSDMSPTRSEEHTSELQSRRNLVCRLLLEKKKKILYHIKTI